MDPGPSTSSNPNRTWICICLKYCNGKPTIQSSKSTFYRHLKEASEAERVKIKAVENLSFEAALAQSRLGLSTSMQSDEAGPSSERDNRSRSARRAATEKLLSKRAREAPQYQHRAGKRKCAHQKEVAIPRPEQPERNTTPPRIPSPSFPQRFSSPPLYFPSSPESVQEEGPLEELFQQPRNPGPQDGAHSPPVPSDEEQDQHHHQGPSKAAAVAIKTMGKKIVKMRPGPTPNGRNLCAHRWLKVFKDSTNGTTAEFKAYYDGLSNEQKAAYDKEAKELASRNAWNKDAYDGTIY